MKPKACKKYRQLINQYIESDPHTGPTGELKEHLRECKACQAYLESFSHVDERTTAWAQSLEPLIEAGQSQTISRLRQMPQPYNAAPAPRWRWLGYAAAACVLLAAGFLVGRGLRPSVDMNELQQQWAATVQPQVEARVTESVLASLRPDIVNEYAKMQDTLSDQITTELKTYAEETVKYNDVQTYHLLSRLIEAIETAQLQNQQWALSAMKELDDQRLLDQQQVRSELAAFAAYTDNELLRTRKDLETLSTEHQ